MRLHHPPLALVERARLLQNLERDLRLADVVKERRFSQCRGRVLIEPELTPNQQAQGRDVDRVAVGEVLVQLDRENLTQGGVARGDLLNQQLHDVADGREIDALASHHIVERPFGEGEREFIRGIERAGWSIRPLHGFPARVERHESPEADVLNLPRGKLHINGLATRRFLELPQEFRQREQFMTRDTVANVNAVDAEIRQLAQDLRLRLTVMTKGDAIEMRRPVDHVEAQRDRLLDVPLDALVELGQLLLDVRVTNRVEAGQPP